MLEYGGCVCTVKSRFQLLRSHDMYLALVFDLIWMVDSRAPINFSIQ